MNANKVADTILSWDTDDELSDKEEIFSGAVRDEEEVSPANIYTDSDSSNGESDDDSKAQPTISSECLLGRDGTSWKRSNPVSSGFAGAHNVFTAEPGIPRDVASSRSLYDMWKHFISEHILRMICIYTNKEAQRRSNDQFTVSLADLETFIGLQYARGIYGKGHPVAFLWSKRYGIPIFYKNMSRDYFLKILKYLRFDDKPNRVRSGPHADKFAPIRQVFEHFANQCQKKCTCKFSLTVDEQLMPLKSRCSFVTFMPNKPDKYNVKFWVLADVETKYVSNIDVYLGAQEKEQHGGVSLAESVVVNLCKHIKGKGYNTTCDNFFTSLSVAEKLARDKLSIVGTIRKNRRELCKKMTETENKATYLSEFYWHDPTNFLFVKYQAKQKKTVCLLSSMHGSADVDASNEKKKPKMILFYNANKVISWTLLLSTPTYCIKK